MARLGLWDQGMGYRFDASRPLVARRAFRADGVDYAPGQPFKKGAMPFRALRRLWMARLVEYGPGVDPEAGPPIPPNYAKLPFFGLLKLARVISGEPVEGKPAALDIVHAELMRRGRAA
jgi:hypothetical protein